MKRKGTQLHSSTAQANASDGGADSSSSNSGDEDDFGDDDYVKSKRKTPNK